ncbi:pyruvate kinase [Paenirhodobacter populi]|uniref:Pyruvate kinase n=1 Tax=Paenirhodobacter populi TaxID=2306993 RepID=A0A443J9S4_9RHOB|nr:pyruvate kinase [Sinirhodobacter populi]RWR17240.1 pyruvate kinase [Sinirhodobacter populi]
MAEPDIETLLHDIETLRAEVTAGAEAATRRWQDWIQRDDFAPSAQNFGQYLALRRHDIRPLQRQLMRFGLSSLGRAESRVMPAIESIRHLLRAAAGHDAFTPVPAADFFAGEARIAARSDAIFGPLSPHGPVRLLVTLPSTAAEDAGFLLRLAELGAEAVRINCAHDDEAAWEKMIAHVEAAAEATGQRMKIFMDLAGPKIRTGAPRDRKGLKRVAAGDELAITLPGRLNEAPKSLAAIECTLPEALEAAGVGQRIFLDDGKLGTRVARREDWGIVVEVGTCPEKGYKLKPEKGINFPETDFDTPALTEDDRAALRFVARHADAVEFSFVQSVADVEALQEALAAERPDDWQALGLVLKIETSRAVRNLPDMLVRAAGRQPTAIMIARGDLAVEIGFARLAEMQEEILWLCEAAQIPVIWATQVLESYLKTGTPSRGEMTDAAMAARAECVMLNKGPYLFEAMQELDQLLGRMNEHMAKKTSLLRPLRSW